ncbi:carbonic anhydrase [Klebsormidium nitens]|uniref:Carbonic anhydrase n=1 Tax=Klebsormidium nitens TaxID=105231 RepID=A0A1Y1IEH4_KLENI|nr:carbonic anhydrase [Klebsormidium nitens]|eukprot:GAQ86508.1 carbonic anhydrase [Klebsormidium nitens]
MAAAHVTGSLLASGVNTHERPSKVAGLSGVATIGEAQFKLLSLVGRKPELKGVVAAKLAALADELEMTLSLDTEKSDNNISPRGPLDHLPLTTTTTPGSGPSERKHEADSNPVDDLKKRFLDFKINYYLKQPQFVEPLKTGQSPKILFIACCDSRVTPEYITKARPGELFVLRNIANLVPPMEVAGKLHYGTSAAIEYAVLHLKVEHIIVNGHRACGGIQALMTQKRGGKTTDTGSKSFIGDWMDVARPAKTKTLEQCGHHDLQTQLRFCEKESVNNSLRNLLTFPWVKQAVDAKRLQLHGWYYDFVEGALSTWKPNTPGMELLT